MNTSFYNGISGIKTHQFGIDVWADNISNVNTTGYKSSNPEFSTIFSTTLSESYFESTMSQVGLGSRPSGTTLNLNQGIFQNTDNVFDLAIGGEGWFGVSSINNQIYYTRAGNFGVDNSGDLVDANGNYLLGSIGGNITPTSLPNETLEEFGRYYGKGTNELGTPYAISYIDDVALSPVEGQTKINLPDILYLPPEPTTEVKYSANLDPKIIIDATQISLNDADINETIDVPNQTININGTITNTPELQNPQIGDVVLVTITDINGNKVETRTTLDNNLNWSITNEDISSLDLTNPITTTAQLQTVQEVPNIEHFSSTVISPTGKKDILDMTYTKRVPQPAQGSVWDGVLQILSYYEKYDPTQTYDPTLYKVDEHAGIVYEIIDEQNGVVEFEPSGALQSATLPTMNNGGTPLNIDVGEPGSFTGFISNIDLDKARTESHDGYVEGLLKDYGMDGRGNVIAEFNNGRSVPIAKIAVFHFQNDQGLEKTTSTLFRESPNSGKPVFYTNESGEAILGSQIFSNKLEGSNVNLATALTELIVMQKAFDASSKSITTSDQMIQNAINMKK